MNVKDWGKRVSRRSDISMGVIHLTKANEQLNSFQVLMKILKEKKLKGSNYAKHH